MNLSKPTTFSIDETTNLVLRKICRAASCRLLLLAFAGVLIFTSYYGIRFITYIDYSLKRMQGNDTYRREFTMNGSVAQQLIRKRQMILIWSDSKNVHFPKTLPDKCGLCEIVTNRSMGEESDAIVINYNHMLSLPNPKTRSSKQIYIWWCRESPSTTKNVYGLDFEKYKFYFNATMTYRRDSEVYYPYAEVLHRKMFNQSRQYVDFHQNIVEKILPNKRHLAVWVVSNCDNTRGALNRMAYASDLVKAGMQIHMFGNCFPGSATFPKYRSSESFELLSQYKFYLAFENAYHCRDYVTEKFWLNALYSGTVPIVWGPSKSDMLLLAPSKSFIHVEDFATAKDLVKYIEYLDANDEAYMEFFEWRFEINELEKNPTKSANSIRHKSAFWNLSRNSTLGFCDICRLLYSERRKQQSIPSLSDWWYRTEDPECVARM